MLRLRVTYGRIADFLADVEQQFSRRGMLVRVDVGAVERGEIVELDIVTPAGRATLDARILQPMGASGVAVELDPSELETIVGWAKHAPPADGPAPIHELVEVGKRQTTPTSFERVDPPAPRPAGRSFTPANIEQIDRSPTPEPVEETDPSSARVHPSAAAPRVGSGGTRPTPASHRIDLPMKPAPGVRRPTPEGIERIDLPSMTHSATTRSPGMARTHGESVARLATDVPGTRTPTRPPSMTERRPTPSSIERIARSGDPPRAVGSRELVANEPEGELAGELGEPTDDAHAGARGGTLEAASHAQEQARRIQLALHGDKNQRMAILRENSRQLHGYVLKNPQLQLDEVVFIARMPTVTADLLGQIANRREWCERPEVASAIVRNPKTPIPLAIRMLDHVSENELRAFAKQGVRDQVQRAARKKLLGSGH